MKATTGRIWLAASKDESRPILTHVYFDAEKGTLAATDSYMAAIVPCKVEEGDESGLIPAEALKVANGESLKISGGKATLSVQKNGTTMERTWTLATGDFPGVTKLVDDAATVEEPFGINPDLLLRLAESMGLGGKTHAPIVLHPVSPLKGMRMDAQDDSGKGVLMPVRLQSSKWPPAAPPATVDLSIDAAILAGVQAFQATMAKRRGRTKAMQAFRDAALQATVDHLTEATNAKAAAA